MTPALWLQRAARLYPDAPALFRGRELVADYQAFARDAACIAGGLARTHGICPGDRVAVFMPNRVEYLPLLYAIWHAGAVAVPINFRLLAGEVAWMVENCGARLLFCAGDAAGELRAPLAGVTVLDIDSADFGALRQAEALPPAPRRPDDLAWLFYTSGTTGRPKGVMITNANIAAMAQSYFIDVDPVSREDTACYAAPMSHGAGLYNFMHVLRAARHVVPASGGFDAAEIVDLAGHHGNLSLFAAPTIVRRIVGHASRANFDGAGIKTIVYGGGPMYLADIIEAVEVLGPRFVQIYGQGESPMTITALSRAQVADRTHPRWRERLGSVGVAQSSVEVRVVDADARELPRGGIGEIVVAGAPVMAGYWGNPAATADALRDGWLWTGDMGAMDEDGFVTLHDRSRDVIISGGNNIYPREVEEALLTHPDVAQVSVIGAPDPEWGETVLAFVVAREGTAPAEAELDAHCTARIARYKRPRRYLFETELPQNAYGKVPKSDLRALLAARDGR